MKFIFAKDLNLAKINAIEDWNMERTGFDRWSDAEGAVVYFAYGVNGLRGRPLGTMIYLGTGYDEHRDYPKVAELIDAGHLTVAARA